MGVDASRRSADGGGGRRATIVALSLFLAACGGDASPEVAATTATQDPVVTTLPTTTTRVTTTTRPLPSPNGELVLVGKIVTMDPDRPEAGAILLHDGFVAVVGSEAEVMAAARPDTPVLDLGEFVAFPGFIDGHSHRMTQRGRWGWDTLEEASWNAAAMGWTGTSELALGPDEFADLRSGSEALWIRAHAYLTPNDFFGDPLGPWYEEYSPGQELGPFLRVTGVKIFIDFDSGRTLLWTVPELGALLRDLIVEQGWHVSMKAIGRESHELALQALEAVWGDPPSGHGERVRLEHSVAATDAQISRMAEHGMVAGIQPSFPAVIWSEDDIKRLADEQGLDTMFRWQDYAAAGIVLTGSPYNPNPEVPETYEYSHVSVAGLLYRSITQVGVSGAPAEPWMLDRALTAQQVLESITTGAAYGNRIEDRLGSLRRGMWADLVVFPVDLRTVPAEQLPEVRPVATLVGGQVAYCRQTEFADWCSDLNTALDAPEQDPDAGFLPFPGFLDRQPLTVTASRSDGSHPFDAVDGVFDTTWNAGVDPADGEQWLAISFPAPRTVSSIRLTVSQWPEGETRHQVWAGATQDSLTMVHEFAGFTRDGDVLEFTPDQPLPDIRAIRVVTVESPSWVAWREVEID